MADQMKKWGRVHFSGNVNPAPFTSNWPKFEPEE